MNRELEEFNKYLHYLVELPPFITQSVNELDIEIRDNCCHIGIQENLRVHVGIDVMLTFLNSVKKSRQEALQRSDLDVELIYYVWHDEQAGQLRFNFINSNHRTLPFRAELIIVDEEKTIVENFLCDKEYSKENFHLMVYKEIIKKYK